MYGNEEDIYIIVLKACVRDLEFLIQLSRIRVWSVIKYGYHCCSRCYLLSLWSQIYNSVIYNCRSYLLSNWLYSTLSIFKFMNGKNPKDKF